MSQRATGKRKAPEATVTLSRLQLRVLIFALTHTYQRVGMHYSPTSADLEREMLEGFTKPSRSSTASCRNKLF
jgi:hypothetical protein